MPEANVLVHHENLREFVTGLFEKTGLSSENAAFFAQSLVDINLWGIDSHGVLRVPIYIKRLKSGACNPRPDIKTIKSAITVEVIDGDNGPGQIVGYIAMKRAIELAKSYNVGLVGAIHSNHFGAAGTFARMAADMGMVGVAMTNVIQNMVAPGGSKPIVGNNPFAIAVPTYGAFPFVLDISLSAVSGGKILWASKKGEKIPLDWATDSCGRPTDDPDTAFRGFLLPAGGHKGLGIAYAIEIMTGLLNGGVFLDEVKGMYKYPDEPSLTSHLMMAINISAFMGREELKKRMDKFYSTIHASPMWDGKAEMLIPGEIEYRTQLKRRTEGIPLPSVLYNELISLAAEMDVQVELKPLS